jgi:hypothetical protein
MTSHSFTACAFGRLAHNGIDQFGRVLAVW